MRLGGLSLEAHDVIRRRAYEGHEGVFLLDGRTYTGLGVLFMRWPAGLRRASRTAQRDLWLIPLSRMRMTAGILHLELAKGSYCGVG